MKQLLQITTSFDQPDLVKDMVERLASRRYEIGYADEKMPDGWQPIEIASSELYTNGIIEFMFNEEGTIRMPFITPFLFSCTHAKNDTYKLNWSLSMS